MNQVTEQPTAAPASPSIALGENLRATSKRRLDLIEQQEQADRECAAAQRKLIEGSGDASEVEAPRARSEALRSAISALTDQIKASEDDLTRMCEIEKREAAHKAMADAAIEANKIQAEIKQERKRLAKLIEASTLRTSEMYSRLHATRQSFRVQVDTLFPGASTASIHTPPAEATQAGVRSAFDGIRAQGIDLDAALYSPKFVSAWIFEGCAADPLFSGRPQLNRFEAAADRIARQEADIASMEKTASNAEGTNDTD
jgi:hypothetical protein